jgi:hypothetical protein
MRRLGRSQGMATFQENPGPHSQQEADEDGHGSPHGYLQGYPGQMDT